MREFQDQQQYIGYYQIKTITLNGQKKMVTSDYLISKMMIQHGFQGWNEIAERLSQQTTIMRNGKQCRQRWNNYLHPLINKSPWTQNDEKIIFQAHSIHGNKWKLISKLLPGRTDNCVKNHFYSIVRKFLRHIYKFRGERNSTVKIKYIKPLVLSRIMEDRNLTSIIFQCNHLKRIPETSLHNFNQILEKLSVINKQHQKQKEIRKKQTIQCRIRGQKYQRKVYRSSLRSRSNLKLQSTQLKIKDQIKQNNKILVSIKDNSTDSTLIGMNLFSHQLNEENNIQFEDNNLFGEQKIDLDGFLDINCQHFDSLQMKSIPIGIDFPQMLKLTSNVSIEQND